MKVLLVEDSDRLRRATAAGLRRLGHVVEEASSRAEADHRIHDPGLDAVVLDRMLPGGDGLDLLATWRSNGVDLPVLVLTALGGVQERIRGLGTGADDYLGKPFSFDELVARLEAIARRRTGAATSARALGPLSFDTHARAVTLDGQRIELTARELSVLDVLTRRPGQVYSRAQLEERIYTSDDPPTSNAIDAAIYALRKKLHTPAGTFIQTRRGLGYAAEWRPSSGGDTARHAPESGAST